LQKRTPDTLRKLRAVEALEYIGTASARPVLEALTPGTPDPRVAEAAAAALARLEQRRKS
jgi:hypothetical protein